MKFLLRIDDALDLFAEHAVGGIIGLMLNAFFASPSIIAMDDVNTGPGGWVNHNWKQLYIQFAYVVATCAYTFVVTAFVAKVIDMIPGLQLRSTPEGEMLGMDEVEVRFPVALTLYEAHLCNRSESSRQITSSCVVTLQIAQRSASLETTSKMATRWMRDTLSPRCRTETALHTTTIIRTTNQSASNR